MCISGQNSGLPERCEHTRILGALVENPQGNLEEIQRKLCSALKRNLEDVRTARLFSHRAGEATAGGHHSVVFSVICFCSRSTSLQQLWHAINATLVFVRTCSARVCTVPTPLRNAKRNEPFFCLGFFPTAHPHWSEGDII